MKITIEINVNNKFESGPAAATLIMSDLGFSRLFGFTGTGYAYPIPINKIINVPIGSRCAKGLRVNLP